MRNFRKVIASTLAIVTLANSAVITANADYMYMPSENDSYWSVSEKLGVDFFDLLEANKASMESFLYLGEPIVIPEYHTNNIVQNNNYNNYSSDADNPWDDSNCDEDYYNWCIEESKNAKEVTINTTTDEKKYTPPIKTHTVNNNSEYYDYYPKFGDCWGTISDDLDVSVESIIEANPMFDYPIFGVPVRIPTKNTMSKSSNKTTNKTKTVSDTQNTEEVKVEYSTECTIVENEQIKEVAPEERCIAKITLYSTADDSSWYNITHAVDIINDFTLERGELFDWWAVDGFNHGCDNRDGFVLATVINDGKYDKGYGGGICFVSTITHQGAMAVNLLSLERHSHGLPVSYAKEGEDATVDYPNLGMAFINTSNSTLRFHYSYSTEHRSLTLRVIDTGV